jgi:tetratricopeptide (TPR) repeat protein
MKKSLAVFFLTMIVVVQSWAQSVQEGINHLYAERFESAKGIFDRMTASNPNNLEATYWLGQTLIKMNNVPAAKSLYEKTLAANGNAPMILAGMGQIDLIEGKTNEARQRFEAAINASRTKKGDDPNVLAAVARANVDTKAGDVAYAIQKLAPLAESTNPNVLLVLGNAYRKAHEGGKAALNYRKAIQQNPAFAVAHLRYAKLFESQRNWDIFEENMNNAIKADPKFAPAYYNLYNYYLLYKRDYATAEKYANQFIANADPTVENDYIKGYNCYIQNNFDCGIQVGLNILSKMGEKANVRIYRLLAYSYLGKGDSATACKYATDLFTKSDEDDLIGNDFLLQIDACGNNDPDAIKRALEFGLKADTTLRGQVTLINTVIDRAVKGKQHLVEGEARLLKYNKLGAQANPADLYYVARPYYMGGQYMKADSIFKAYSAVFPDSIYGHYYSALSLARADSGNVKGIAIPAYEKLLEVALKDPVRHKDIGISAAGFLMTYYNNVKADRATALKYAEIGLQFDPNHPGLLNAQKQLKGSPAPPPPPAAQAKTGTGTNGTKTTTTTTKPKTTTVKTKTKAKN